MLSIYPQRSQLLAACPSSVHHIRTVHYQRSSSIRTAKTVEKGSVLAIPQRYYSSKYCRFLVSRVWAYLSRDQRCVVVS